jgi:hypothetical protein
MPPLLRSGAQKLGRGGFGRLFFTGVANEAVEELWIIVVANLIFND